MQLKVSPGEDALHRVLDSVSSVSSPAFVASGAQIKIVANEAFVAPASKVSLQAGIAANTCNSPK